MVNSHRLLQYTMQHKVYIASIVHRHKQPGNVKCTTLTRRLKTYYNILLGPPDVMRVTMAFFDLLSHRLSYFFSIFYRNNTLPIIDGNVFKFVFIDPPDCRVYRANHRMCSSLLIIIYCHPSIVNLF